MSSLTTLEASPQLRIRCIGAFLAHMSFLSTLKTSIFFLNSAVLSKVSFLPTLPAASSPSPISPLASFPPFTSAPASGSFFIPIGLRDIRHSRVSPCRVLSSPRAGVLIWRSFIISTSPRALSPTSASFLVLSLGFIFSCWGFVPDPAVIVSGHFPVIRSWSLRQVLAPGPLLVADVRGFVVWGRVWQVPWSLRLGF